jgi:hypothetical protein
MINGNVLAAALIQLATVCVAVWGVWKCRQLQRFGADRRLTALAVFFGLFAAGVLLNAVWQVQVQSDVRFFGPAPPGPDGVLGGGVRFNGNGTFNDTVAGGRSGGPFVFFLRPEGTENANLWLAGHHLLILAALVVGVWAFGPHRPAKEPTVAAGFAVLGLSLSFGFVGELVPTMLALEAGLMLYLAIRAYLNHVQVRSPGAIQVAMGFLLFFAGHLVLSVLHQPGMGHAALGDVLNLVGLVLLVQVLPPTTPALAPGTA